MSLVQRESQVFHPNSRDPLNSVKFKDPESPQGSCSNPIQRDTYSRANWQVSVNRSVVQGDAMYLCWCRSAKTLRSSQDLWYVQLAFDFTYLVHNASPTFRTWKSIIPFIGQEDDSSIWIEELLLSMLLLWPLMSTTCYPGSRRQGFSIQTCVMHTTA